MCPGLVNWEWLTYIQMATETRGMHEVSLETKKRKGKKKCFKEAGVGN